MSESSTESRPSGLFRANPANYLMAATMATGKLPVVGKHLEQIGGYTAMGNWLTRNGPSIVGGATRSWLVPGQGKVRKAEREQAHVVSYAGLRGLVPDEDLNITWPMPERTPPLLKSFGYRRNLYRSAVPYGAESGQVLDVWRRPDLPPGPAPVMLFLPGGAWVHGGRILQGYALMSHLAELGWVCLSVEYRVSPAHRWPRHIHDVKAAIAWARANADAFGGDRNFVTVAGCSAGGHLAALAGLTAGAPEFEDHLPSGSDTSVDAVVGIYGRYDWEDRSTHERARFIEFLERVVVKRSIERDPEVFRNASPIHRVTADAPPFLAVHGSNDSIIPVEQARGFVHRLREVSRSEVGYIELPGAGHGFDMTDGARTGIAATAIGLFLNQIRRRQESGEVKQAI